MALTKARLLKHDFPVHGIISPIRNNFELHSNSFSCNGKGGYLRMGFAIPQGKRSLESGKATSRQRSKGSRSGVDLTNPCLMALSFRESPSTITIMNCTSRWTSGWTSRCGIHYGYGASLPSKKAFKHSDGHLDVHPDVHLDVQFIMVIVLGLSLSLDRCRRHTVKRNRRIRSPTSCLPAQRTD